MLETSNWEKIEYSEAPQEIKEFVRYASLTEQKLSFSNLVLREEDKRARIRRKLIDSEERIQFLLKRFNNFINKGYSEKIEKERDRANEINKVLKGLWERIEEAKWSEKIGITDEVPLEAPLQMYSNYLRKILSELIYGSLTDAVEEKGGNFYNKLFNSVWKWCQIQLFTPIQKIEKEEEEEGEEEEVLDVSDEITEKVGKIG